MRIYGWALLIPIAVECLRSDSSVVGHEDVAVTGKVVQCRVGGVLIFNEVAEESKFSASWENIDVGAGVKGWGINVPGIVRIVVDSNQITPAKKGFWITPSIYEVSSIDIDSSGLAIRNALPDGENFEGMSIVWGSPYTLRVLIRKDNQETLIIDFTKLTGRIDLPAAEYNMPMQGLIMSLKVDGQTVFDKESSTSEYPVGCTPAFFEVSKIARGLGVNVANLTWFWVSKTQIQKYGYFGPNSHGYSTSTDLDETTTQMLDGLRRWWHRTTDDGVDHDANLTIKSDANTVEISGNGTELVFSKEQVEGNLIKCTVNKTIVFDKEEHESHFTASWGYNVDENDGADGWYVDIPKIVRFDMRHDFLEQNPDNKFMATYDEPSMTLYSGDIDPSGTPIQKNMSGDKTVRKISTVWNSHKSVTIIAEMDDNTNVEIEFTRGPRTAAAENDDKLDELDTN